MQLKPPEGHTRSAPARPTRFPLTSAVDRICMALDGRWTLCAGGGISLTEPTVEIPSVDWWITSHCNLACDFCYGPVPKRDPVKRRNEILRALADSSARVVTFCGGEPLLVTKIGQSAAML